MATAVDKKKWDSLHAAYAKAHEALSEYELALGSKYGHNFNASWLTRGQRDKLDKLHEKKSAIGDKIIDLLVHVSPRGDRWLSGVPSWWLRERLTWEDAIRPVNEPLSVVVPGAWGYPDGTVQENVAAMPRSLSTDPNHLREILEKGVVLVGGEVVDNNSIDLDSDEPVVVAIVFNATGTGRQPGAISAAQGDHPDAALEVAHEILEEWEHEHYGRDEHATETFDGQIWELPVDAFLEAIEGTEAEKLLDIVGGEDNEEIDEEEEEEVDEEEVDDETDEDADLRESSRNDRPDDIRVYWDRQDPRNEGWAYNAYWRDERGRITHEDSGPIEGRRDMSDATLTSRARAAVGYPGTRIPVEVVR